MQNASNEQLTDKIVDFFTDQEKVTIANKLAVIAKIPIADSTEYQHIELIDDSMAYAKMQVANNHWSPAVAQEHVYFSVNAAASSYASMRAIKQKRVREAFSGLWQVLASVINSRIGFKLIPDQQPG